MATSIRILAVGDILMWGTQIAYAKTASGYRFDGMFSAVRPILQSAHITIGNLETTFSGRERVYQQTNPKTGYPKFNCPDELAGALKRSGFNVLTTANNHCMDRGARGLKRTLDVLDRAGIQHTGTFRSRLDRHRPLIVIAKGIRVGILSYTYGTNFIPVPKETPWLVNRIHVPTMVADVKRMKRIADMAVVCVHFGEEFRRRPNKQQRQVVRALLAAGADIVFGAHPHVVQPLVFTSTRREGGSGKGNSLVCYSLGNFISDRMLKNPHTQSGVIVGVTVEKQDGGGVKLKNVSYVPTWTSRSAKAGYRQFRVYPIARTLAKPPKELSADALAEMKRERQDTLRHLAARK